MIGVRWKVKCDVVGLVFGVYSLSASFFCMLLHGESVHSVFLTYFLFLKF